MKPEYRPEHREGIPQTARSTQTEIFVRIPEIRNGHGWHGRASLERAGHAERCVGVGPRRSPGLPCAPSTPEFATQPLEDDILAAVKRFCLRVDQYSCSELRIRGSRCCSARELRAERRDKPSKWLDTTESNLQAEQHPSAHPGRLLRCRPRRGGGHLRALRHDRRVRHEAAVGARSKPVGSRRRPLGYEPNGFRVRDCCVS